MKWFIEINRLLREIREDSVRALRLIVEENNFVASSLLTTNLETNFASLKSIWMNIFPTTQLDKLGGHIKWGKSVDYFDILERDIPALEDIIYRKLDEQLLSIAVLPLPHSDMPEEIKEDYEEAVRVFPYSVRSSAALLRLAIQKLCRELGGKGEDLNKDIGELVVRGLPVHIQLDLPPEKCATCN